MNLFVGIDFSKEKFDVTVIFCENLSEVRSRISSQFKNGLKGYKSLTKWIRKFYVEGDSILFCGEKTGVYSSALSFYLFYAGYDIWLEDPYQIKHSIGLQRNKDDKADSGFIADYAMRHQDKKVIFKPTDPQLDSLKELFQFRYDLTEERKRLLIRLKEKMLTNNKINDVKDEFCKIQDNTSFDFMQKSTNEIVDQINEQLKSCEDKINELIDKNPDIKENFDIITSIKGVAKINAIALIVYTLNFSRFDFNARKIACYYGIAPFGRSSGSSVRHSPHTSFMANKLLKSILTMAAVSAVQHSSIFREFYQARIRRGKKPMVALNDTKNKILHIVVAMVKNKTFFNENFLLEKKLEYMQKTA